MRSSPSFQHKYTSWLSTIAGKSSSPTSRSLIRQPVERIFSRLLFITSARFCWSIRFSASFAYGTSTPPIIMIRVETAVKSCSSTESFLRAPMASIRKGSSSWRVRSASVRVNNRCGCSGCSSRSSSWSSGIRFRPFPGQLGAYRKDSTRGSRSLVKPGAREGLSADENHRPRRRLESGFVDAMAGLFFHNHGANPLFNVVVGSAVPQQRAKVMIVLAEQARAHLAVGGQANARTVPAERLCDRRDQADLAARAVSKFILARGFALRVRNLRQRPLGVNAPVNLLGRNHQFPRPVAVGIERHELDKSHDHTAIARERGEGFHLVFVKTTDEHSI